MLTKIQPKRGHKTGIREQFNFDAIALPAFIPNLFECASLTSPRPLGSLDSLFARPLFDPKGDLLSANGRGNRKVESFQSDHPVLVLETHPQQQSCDRI